MPKLNTPLLSLEAHGTVGNAITYQGRGREKVARSKPKLPYSLTLAQQYQRWLYEDYAYLWTQQSVDTQASYRTAGVRFHRTGYQQWISVMLSTWPDILFWDKLDNTRGAVAYDSSKEKNHGVVFGASQVDGRIAKCLYFDGLNDEVRHPADVSALFTGDFSLAFNMRCVDPTREQYLIYSREFGGQLIGLLVSCIPPLGRLWCYYDYGVGSADAATPAGITANTWYSVVYNHDTVKTELWLDATLMNSRAGSIVLPGTGIFKLGTRLAIGKWYKGELDNLIIRNRTLDPTEIERHSLRRYAPK